MESVVEVLHVNMGTLCLKEWDWGGKLWSKGVNWKLYFVRTLYIPVELMATHNLRQG